MLALVKLWDQGTTQPIFSRAYFSRCTTIVPNFVLLAYPYPEIQGAGKVHPTSRTCTDPDMHGSSKVKNYWIFKENTQNENIVHLFRIKIEKTSLQRSVHKQKRQLFTRIVQVQMIFLKSCNSQFINIHYNNCVLLIFLIVIFQSKEKVSTNRTC